MELRLRLRAAVISWCSCGGAAGGVAIGGVAIDGVAFDGAVGGAVGGVVGGAVGRRRQKVRIGDCGIVVGCWWIVGEMYDCVGCCWMEEMYDCVDSSSSSSESPTAAVSHLCWSVTSGGLLLSVAGWCRDCK